MILHLYTTELTHACACENTTVGCERIEKAERQIMPKAQNLARDEKVYFLRGCSIKRGERRYPAVSRFIIFGITSESPSLDGEGDENDSPSES